MRGQSIVYETLDRLGIGYEGLEHDPVYTVEQLESVPFPGDVMVAKNLFLRDAKGKRHFLVVLPKNQAVDLRALEGAIGSTRLTFASEDRLHRHLGLTKGSVSPFGVLNDANLAVEVILGKTLAEYPRLGFHPNDNTATLFLAFADLLKVIEDHGNAIRYI